MKHLIALSILFVSITSHASTTHDKSCDLGDNNYRLSCVPESIIETNQCETYMKKHYNLDATFIDQHGHELSVDQLCDAE